MQPISGPFTEYVGKLPQETVRIHDWDLRGREQTFWRGAPLAFTSTTRELRARLPSAGFWLRFWLVLGFGCPDLSSWEWT